MRFSKWYDMESKSEKVFLELSPGQAVQLKAFLQDQIDSGFPPKTLTVLGELTTFDLHGTGDSKKGLIMIGIV